MWSMVCVYVWPIGTYRFVCVACTCSRNIISLTHINTAYSWIALWPARVHVICMNCIHEFFMNCSRNILNCIPVRVHVIFMNCVFMNCFSFFFQMWRIGFSKLFEYVCSWYPWIRKYCFWNKNKIFLKSISISFALTLSHIHTHTHAHTHTHPHFSTAFLHIVNLMSSMYLSAHALPHKKKYKLTSHQQTNFNIDENWKKNHRRNIKQYALQKISFVNPPPPPPNMYIPYMHLPATCLLLFFLEQAKDDVTEKADLTDFYSNMFRGKNSATGGKAVSVLCCRVLQGVAGCCRVLQDVAGCCRVLQGVAGCCMVLQCVVGCCSVLQVKIPEPAARLLVF